MSCSVISNEPKQVLKQQPYMPSDHSFLTINMHLIQFEKKHIAIDLS